MKVKGEASTRISLFSEDRQPPGDSVFGKDESYFSHVIISCLLSNKKAVPQIPAPTLTVIPQTCLQPHRSSSFSLQVSFPLLHFYTIFEQNLFDLGELKEDRFDLHEVAP